MRRGKYTPGIRKNGGKFAQLVIKTAIKNGFSDLFN
jgi:hypothetical protein